MREIYFSYSYDNGRYEGQEGFDNDYDFFDNYYSSGEYGPYIPDAVGFSVNGNVKTGLFGEFYVNAGIAFDKFNNFAVFGGYGGNFGWNGTLGKPGFGAGATIDMHDNYGNNTDVLGGLGGTNKGYFLGAGFLNGSFSKSAERNSETRSIEWIRSGVSTTSVGLGFGLGGGMNISNGGVIKF